jgi:hypothetical protein
MRESKFSLIESLCLIQLLRELRLMQIFTRTTSVRVPKTMHDELIELSNLVHKHPSQLIRDSISQFITTQRRQLQETKQ